MHRRIWGAVAVVLFSVFQAYAPALAAPMPGAAKIMSIEGAGYIRESNTAPWKPAAVKKDLFAGNTVRTGSFSRMAILFRDRTQIRMREKTVLFVKQVSDPAKRTGMQTILRLNSGRAWTQSKTPPAGLSIETLSATAAIRGTDWELAVEPDGATTLTVLSGKVEFFNDIGKITVQSNEQARAEVGKMPVKLVMVNARDRVQWVTAYPVDPLRHITFRSSRPADVRRALDAVTGSGPEQNAERACLLADLGKWHEATALFQAVLSEQPENAKALVGMVFSSLRNGNTGDAEKFLRSAEQGRQANPELLQLARISVLIQESKIEAATEQIRSMMQGKTLRFPSVWLIQSDLLIHAGELDQAERTVQEGMARFPDSASLSSQEARILMLRGRTDAARQQAEQALSKDSESADALLVLGDLARISGNAASAMQYYRQVAAVKLSEDRAWYGMGVVDTEREDAARGRKEMQKALDLNPSGAGYQGQRGTLETFANRFRPASQAFAAALDGNPDDYVALTGHGIMELKRGHPEAALNDFLQAELMEPRYARVHLYKAVAYYQLEFFDQAFEELRRSEELDEKDPLPHFMASIMHSDLYEAGKAVDEARAAIGLMPYLKSLNQLETDQRGSANLGRAFADFGMEEWAQSYAQESYYPFWAGSHLFLADRYTGFFDKNSELFQGYLADPTVFGAGNRFNSLIPVPGDYVTAGFRAGKNSEQTATQPTVQLNGLWNGSFPTAYFLNYEPSDIRGDEEHIDWKALTAAVGMKPSDNLGMFVFGSGTDIDQSISTQAGGMQFDLQDSLRADRIDAGFHYSFSPVSQLWFKAGAFKSDDHINGTISGSPITSDVDVRQPEYALRHTVRLGNSNELTWGGEIGRRETNKNFLDEVIPGGFINSRYDFTDRSWEAYISDRWEPSKNLLLEADFPYQKHVRTATYPDYGLIPPAPEFLLASSGERFNQSGFKPRAGFVYKFGEERLIRVAYQDWVRPVEFSSLGPVATAGIPLEDRLVTSGGELHRVRGQLEWQWSPGTFTMLFVDHKSVDNQPFINAPFTITEIEDLFKLQQRNFATLASDDLLEGTPSFSKGRVNAAGFGLNQILTGSWSVFVRYVGEHSLNTSVENEGKQLPYLPRMAAAIGTTWVGPYHLFFITRFIYRSEQFTDEANTIRRQGSWDGSYDLFWESPKKYLLARIGVDEMLDKNDPTFYSAELSIRY